MQRVRKNTDFTLLLVLFTTGEGMLAYRFHPAVQCLSPYPSSKAIHFLLNLFNQQSLDFLASLIVLSLTLALPLQLRTSLKYSSLYFQTILI